MCIHVIGLVIVVHGQCGGREQEFDLSLLVLVVLWKII